MNNPYYQCPSDLGQPLLDLMCIDAREDCISTIEYYEEVYGFDFCHCSIIKYVWRLGNKGLIGEECHKILDYIKRATDGGSGMSETLEVVACRLKEIIEENQPMQ
jgi:hypothetical protein